MNPMRRHTLMLTLALALLVPIARAQTITVPPSGDNQKASVSQNIGLVTVRIDYSSPNVHGPNGEDRSGHIWGGLVPYGMADVVYNDCKECPWRAGANENTVFTVSHDVLIEGKPLKAGAYGLHMIPGEDEWTLIFSNNSEAWGSFFYQPDLDALRVKVKPAKSDYHEWLTYEFDDRETDHTKAILKWENLQIPFTVSVPNIKELYYAKISRELTGARGFSSADLVAGSQYCMQNKLHLDSAMLWAQKAVSATGAGIENFNTVSNLALAQMANGKTEDGSKTLQKAFTLPDVSAPAAHQLARQLQAAGHPAVALQVFEMNFKRFKGAWPTSFGMARGYEGVGDLPKAIAAAKAALPKAPDELNKKNIQGFIDRLEKKVKGS